MKQTVSQALVGMSGIFAIVSRLVGVVVAVGGVILAASGVSTWIDSRPYGDGERVQGTVAFNDSITVTDVDGGTRELYTPVIVYQVDGADYQIKGRSSRPVAEPIGTVFDVSYRPADPGDGRLLGSSAGIGLAIGGALGLVAGIVIFAGGTRYACYLYRRHNQSA